MYQEAIEANYSHEQMTPLNCIIGQSKIVKDELICFLKKIRRSIPDNNQTKELENLDENI